MNLCSSLGLKINSLLMKYFIAVWSKSHGYGPVVTHSWSKTETWTRYGVPIARKKNIHIKLTGGVIQRFNQNQTRVSWIPQISSVILDPLPVKAQIIWKKNNFRKNSPNKWVMTMKCWTGSKMTKRTRICLILELCQVLTRKKVSKKLRLRWIHHHHRLVSLKKTLLKARKRNQVSSVFRFRKHN